MNPSIVNNRARTVQGSDGKAQPTTSSRGRSAQARRTRGFDPNSVDCRHPTWFACCAPDFQGRIETQKSVGRESQLNSAKW